MRKHALKFLSLISFVATVAICIPQRAAADQDDPPTRIARISQIDGSVSLDPAGTDDWIDAALNRPMTTGDKLWADHDSRAELHLGSASIRLGANTGFSFLNLDDNTTQVQLTEGTLRIRVQRLHRDEIFEIDTPNLAFSVLSPGIYRITVNEAGDGTMVTVREGEGSVTGGGQSFSVYANETGDFTGTDQVNADIEGIGDEDDLDRWSYERDRREDHSISRRYVSDEAVGYEDLDEYGGWRDTPDYGTVWFPHTTVVGWAPYRYGHWVWISPWGYTWVEDEPWGFAPFHYGRWVVVGGDWGWVPCRPAGFGVAYVRPVYAPALVAWVGGPSFAVGIGVGGGAVGWFPLGPREVYVPSYPVSRAYVTRVNVTNTTVNTTVVNNYYTNVVVNKNVTNVRYVNQGAPNAVTATSQETFTSGQSVHNNVVRVNEREIARAPVAFSAPATAPTRQAVLGGGRPTTVRPPAAMVNRAVVAKTAPPPPPARFERQQAAIQQNGGRPLAISETRQMQQQQQQPKAEVRMAPPARPGTATQNAGNRQAPSQNSNRPAQQPGNAQQNNRPATDTANAERPNNVPPPNGNRPGTPPANVERPNAERPNNVPPPNANRPNTPPPNVQHNDRPPARPANPPPNGNPQLERQHQQELENMRKQQDQQRQRLEQQQNQERQRANQQRADDQRKQQMQEQQQRQLQELERKHDQQQQQVQQRQQQEHQQQRQQGPPPRQQPQERPKQQERPNQQDKSKDKPPRS